MPTVYSNTKSIQKFNFKVKNCFNRSFASLRMYNVFPPPLEKI